jgi:hypothetical protein
MAPRQTSGAYIREVDPSIEIALEFKKFKDSVDRPSILNKKQ